MTQINNSICLFIILKFNWYYNFKFFIMKKLANLEGVITLSKQQQKVISGGLNTEDEYPICFTCPEGYRCNLNSGLCVNV